MVPLQISQWIPGNQLQSVNDALDSYDELKDVSPEDVRYNEFRACRAKINSVLNLYVIGNTEFVKELGLTEKEVGLIRFGDSIDVRDEVRDTLRTYLKNTREALLTALSPEASEEARANANKPGQDPNES